MISPPALTPQSINGYLGFPDNQPSPLYPIKEAGERMDIKKEIRKWFSPLNILIYLWPVILFRNKMLKKEKFFSDCSLLPHFNSLWETISKGSFAYNTFLFKKSAIGKNSGNTLIADLTCLALLFGDEFIDGLCNELGKDFIQELLNKGSSHFYLLLNKKNNSRPELVYGFNLYELLPDHVWKIRNEKYGITYASFYKLLTNLLQLLNKRLEKLNPPAAWSAAGKIKEACDLCFNTFIHDVLEAPSQSRANGNSSSAHFHEKKNHRIQEKLLELRCILLHKKTADFEKKFSGWLDIISTMQVYDDLQDCRNDENFQDNLLLETAVRNFPAEYDWFVQNKTKQYTDEEWRRQVSLCMPCSVYQCLKFSKEKIAGMDWTQKKICNYLWQQNWFVTEKKSSATRSKTNPGDPVSELHHIVELTKPVFFLTSNEYEWKSFAFETAFHDRKLKKYIFSQAGWIITWFLNFNLLQLSNYEKTNLLNRILSKRFTAAS